MRCPANLTGSDTVNCMSCTGSLVFISSCLHRPNVVLLLFLALYFCLYKLGWIPMTISFSHDEPGWLKFES